MTFRTFRVTFKYVTRTHTLCHSINSEKKEQTVKNQLKIADFTVLVSLYVFNVPNVKLGGIEIILNF